MKKELIKRCVLGAPVGLAISTMITIVISLIVNDGNFYPVVPDLIDACGNEMNAVTVQAIASMIYGCAYAGASVIWDVENWSILKQTVTHFIVCSLGTLPIAYFMHWMNHSVLGVITYFAIFIGIYVIIWISQYSAMKKKIEEFNKKVQEQKAEL